MASSYLGLKGDWTWLCGRGAHSRHCSHHIASAVTRRSRRGGRRRPRGEAGEVRSSSARPGQAQTDAAAVIITWLSAALSPHWPPPARPAPPHSAIIPAVPGLCHRAADNPIMLATQIPSHRAPIKAGRSAQRAGRALRLAKRSLRCQRSWRRLTVTKAYLLRGPSNFRPCAMSCVGWWRARSLLLVLLADRARYWCTGEALDADWSQPRDGSHAEP